MAEFFGKVTFVLGRPKTVQNVGAPHPCREFCDRVGVLTLSLIEVPDRKSGVRRRVDVGAHHAHLVILLIQVVHQDVAQRDHADQLSLMANRQMAKSMAPQAR